MLKSFFYVSAKTRLHPHDAADLEDIVAVAQSRNAALDVTGVLIATDRNFAQIIEGSDAAIEDLTTAILADSRHYDVTVLDLPPHETRWYPDWSLAYSGPASFVASRLKPLLGGSTDPLDVSALLKLMRAFQQTH